jgi:arabinofuranan 3-O-arabinosyltransferase
MLDATAGTGSVGIATLIIPGLTPTRTLQVPTGTATPDLITFSALDGARSGCLTIAGRAAGDPTFAERGESDGVIDRTFSLPGDAAYQLRARVVASPGPQLNQLLDAGRSISAVASSVDSQDPRERPGAAVDGDPATSWVAASGDLRPSLRLRLAGGTELSTVRLSTDPGAPIARPTRVSIVAGGHRWNLPVPDDGLLRLPRPVRTDTVGIAVLTAQLRLNSSTIFGGQRLLPAGISEISVNGAVAPASSDDIRFGCGVGLGMQVGERLLEMQASASRVQLLSGQPFDATPCSTAPLSLAQGSQHLRLAAAGPLSPTALILTRQGVSGPPPGADDAGTAEIGSWHATHRTVSVRTDAAALLVVHENANPGWQATLNGRRLQPVTVDGWQQGWRLPAGVTGTVSLSYLPQRGFGLGLIAGALAVLLLCALCFVRPGAVDTRAAVPERAWPERAYLALALTGSLLLAGPVGLLVGAGVAAGYRWLPRRPPYWAAAAPLLLAGIAEAARPSGSPHPLAGAGWVQGLCVSAFCLLVLGATGLRQPGVENRRSSGRSKNSQDSVASTVEQTAVSSRSFQKWP